jgi:hypothetical protein
VDDHGVPDLDLDDGLPTNHTTLLLSKGLPSADPRLPAPPSRTVKIGKQRVYFVPLEAGEAGSIAEVSFDDFEFPYLYSVPRLWAFSPSQLLVPRSIALADELTVI